MSLDISVYNITKYHIFAIYSPNCFDRLTQTGHAQLVKALKKLCSRKKAGLGLSHYCQWNVWSKTGLLHTFTSEVCFDFMYS